MKTNKRFAAVALITLAACSSTPPPPDWQMNAQQSLARAIEAYFEGNARVEAAEFARAKSEIARTGRADLMARAELARCAAAVASLVEYACPGFDALRTDAPSAEVEYANYIAGQTANVAALPPQHRATASASTDAAALQAVRAIADPAARLIAAGVVFRRGNASPALLQAAVDTASAQGWRRPLLAWLGAQQLRAEKAGDAAEVERIKRRMALVGATPGAQHSPAANPITTK
jgi:hypothetical protein